MSTNKNTTLVIRKPSEKQGDLCEFVFKNALTIETVSGKMDRIMQSLEKYPGFKITLKENTDTIDLGGLQTLLFIRKYGKENNKPVQWDVQPADKIKQLLQQTGFEDLIQ